jgi:hypothetical protein
MTITVNGFDGNPVGQNSFDGMQGRFIKTYLRVALSGNCPAGGDTLDLTNGGVNSAVPPLGRVIESILPKEHAGGASGSSFMGSGGYCEVSGIPGVTAPNAWKLQFFAAGGTQQSGAYTGFTGGSALVDVIELEVNWAR